MRLLDAAAHCRWFFSRPFDVSWQRCAWAGIRISTQFFQNKIQGSYWRARLTQLPVGQFWIGWWLAPLPLDGADRPHRTTVPRVQLISGNWMEYRVVVETWLKLKYANEVEGETMGCNGVLIGRRICIAVYIWRVALTGWPVTSSFGAISNDWITFRGESTCC